VTHTHTHTQVSHTLCFKELKNIRYYIILKLSKILFTKSDRFKIDVFLMKISKHFFELQLLYKNRVLSSKFILNFKRRKKHIHHSIPSGLKYNLNLPNLYKNIQYQKMKCYDKRIVVIFSIKKDQSQYGLLQKL